MKATRVLARLMVAGTACFLLTGCAARGAVRREHDAARSALAAERQERVASDDSLRATITALRGELQTLRTEAGAQITALVESFQFAFPIPFSHNGDTLSRETYAELDRMAEVVAKYYPSALLTVHGHTDVVPPERGNIGLSRRRAGVVRDYLISKGLSAQQLRAIGHGSDDPLVFDGNGRPVGSSDNRRVVFTIETRGSAPGSSSR